MLSDRVENIVRKAENAGHQHFLLFPQCFQRLCSSGLRLCHNGLTNCALCNVFTDTNIDPSLHERQRLLKKARLTDSLNDKLSHRPGILELVQGNILQTDGKLQQLIKGNTGNVLCTSVLHFCPTLGYAKLI